MTLNVLFPEYNIIEPKNFIMDREHGASRYIFFHFINPVIINLDNEEIRTNPGAVILFEPGVPQKFTTEERINHDYVDFEVFDQSFLKDIHFPVNKVIYPRMSKEITSTIKNIHDLQRQEIVGSAYEMEAIFTKLLISIARTSYLIKNYKEYSNVENTKAMFEQLRLGLYENPSKITVSLLAEKTGFSYSYFNKLYKEQFGVSPIVDVKKSRLLYTKNCLLKGVDVYTLVDELGFSNIEYFYHWFKKEIKMTPREFANKKLKEK